MAKRFRNASMACSRWGRTSCVENVTAKNATGYAFWSNGQSPSTRPAASFVTAYAENSNILFETNFSDGVLFENCRGGDGDADILAPGAFRPVGGFEQHNLSDCYYKGSAIAIDALANVGAQTNIVFE